EDLEPPRPCRRRSPDAKRSGDGCLSARACPNHGPDLGHTINQRASNTSRKMWVRSLAMELTAAPFFGSKLGERFGKVPPMAVKILSVVLALAIRLVRRFAQYDRTVLPRALTVALRILDADLNDVRGVWRHLALGNREAAVARFHLNAVVGDASAEGAG